MPKGVIAVLRSIAAVIGGYLTVAGGTILTFNVLVGQVTVNSPPLQLMLGSARSSLAWLVECSPD